MTVDAMMVLVTTSCGSSYCYVAVVIVSAAVAADLAMITDVDVDLLSGSS